MRFSRFGAVILLGILSACGGGDDISSPPDGAPESFALTITGGGSGSGRVATAAGTTPSLACDLAGSAAPVGACSAAYPEGTVVALNVAPAEGSVFVGWGGDAAMCGNTPACSVTMSKDQAVEVQLSSGLAGVEVVSSSFYPEPELDGQGFIIGVVEVRNASSELVETVELLFTSRDASGAVLGTASAFVGPIPPGETRVGQSFLDHFGTEVTTDFQVVDVVVATGPSRLGDVEFVSTNWSADAAAGSVPWSVEVRNTTAADLEFVQIEFSTYDAAGQILAADFAILEPIPPGETRTAEGFAHYRGSEATAKFQIVSVE